MFLLCRHSKYLIFASLLAAVSPAFSQFEAMNWCFGTNAGLSFTSNPPTSFTNSSMNTLEGCASISSPTGQLLFYTDGITVWDQTNSVMANGTGLTGNSSSSQSGVIIKQPGNSNIYYVFSVPAAGIGSLNYSIVDISLAAGLGSVTSKNNVLFSPTAEKLTASRHCNGVDVWIIGHEQNSNIFRAYLLTPGGLSSTAVTSSIGMSYSGFNYAGYMKTSPSGKKLAVAVYSGRLELFDFDNSTGIVSNPLVINSYSTMYGCEFSPDGSKLYAGTWYTTSPGLIYQYDLCAGSPAAIVASEIVIASSIPFKGALQLAPDGKIYAIRYQQSELGVINNPNLPGTLCNYIDQGQTIAPKTCVYGLPNFLTSDFEPPPTPFTYTISSTMGCQTASFSSNYNPTITALACSTIGYSITGLHWDFGDPASGSANTSTVQNPVHAFTNLGTYNVNLILYYSCGGGTDTIKRVININCLSVNSTSITCASLGSATVQALSGVGPYSYTWMPTNQTSSVASGLSPGAYTLSVFDAGLNSTYTTQIIFGSPSPFSGKINTSTDVTCAGAATGTGNVTNITGGSGNQNYLWTNGSLTYTTATTNSLSAGAWTIVVTDALTGCQFGRVAYIKEPPSMSMTLSSSSQSACAGQKIILTGINSGGAPSKLAGGYTYTWSGGPSANTWTVSENYAGTYIYSLSSGDSLHCIITNTISVDFIPSPGFSVTGSQMQGCAPFYSEYSLVKDSSDHIGVRWDLKGKTISTQSTFTYSFDTIGDYFFTARLTDVLNSCTSTNTFVVRALPQPVADFDFEPKNPIEGLETIFFTNKSSGSELSKFSWHFMDNLGYTSIQKNTFYYFPNAGRYPVALTVSDGNGCADTVIKTVEILPDFSFYIPNAFTPNDDGRNDFFYPVARGVKFYEMFILNRWGHEIFQTTDLSEGWNGYYKNEACKQDSYVWKIKLTTFGGEEKEYTGNVLLIR